jgi:hypothetical protein
VTTIFANVMNLRVTPTEFVLEFGSFFPDRPGPAAPPSDYKPDVRVVMNISALQGLLNGLQQANQQHTQAKPAPGFKTQ